MHLAWMGPLMREERPRSVWSVWGDSTFTMSTDVGFGKLTCEFSIDSGGPFSTTPLNSPAEYAAYVCVRRNGLRNRPAWMTQFPCQHASMTYLKE